MKVSPLYFVLGLSAFLAAKGYAQVPSPPSSLSFAEDSVAEQVIRDQEWIIVSQFEPPKKDIKDTYKPNNEVIKAKVAQLRNNDEFFQKMIDEKSPEKLAILQSKVDAIMSLDRMEQLMESAKLSNVSIPRQLAQTIADSKGYFDNPEVAALMKNYPLLKANIESGGTEVLSAEQNKLKLEELKRAKDENGGIIGLQFEALVNARNLGKRVDEKLIAENNPNFLTVATHLTKVKSNFLSPPPGPYAPDFGTPPPGYEIQLPVDAPVIK